MPVRVASWNEPFPGKPYSVYWENRASEGSWFDLDCNKLDMLDRSDPMSTAAEVDFHWHHIAPHRLTRTVLLAVVVVVVAAAVAVVAARFVPFFVEKEVDFVSFDWTPQYRPVRKQFSYPQRLIGIEQSHWMMSHRNCDVEAWTLAMASNWVSLGPWSVAMDVLASRYWALPVMICVRAPMEDHRNNDRSD